jgi:hypothetical protein
MTAARTCEGCGEVLPPPKRSSGRQRKWCTDRCRKQTLYSRPCIDCGAALNGSDGHKGATRCKPCAARVSGAARKVWTPAAVILAIQEWAAEHGEPPALPDWSATHARAINDEARAERYERALAAGECPGYTSVIRAFGSWNAGIAAAGFTPRAPHMDAANAQRLRSMRAKVAA